MALVKLSCKHVAESKGSVVKSLYCKSCRSNKDIAFYRPLALVKNYALFIYADGKKDITFDDYAGIHKIKLDKNNFITEVEKDPIIGVFKYFDMYTIDQKNIDPKFFTKFLKPISKDIGDDYNLIYKELPALYKLLPSNFLVNKI